MGFTGQLCSSRQNPNYPSNVYGRSSEIPGWGQVLKVKILEEKYEAKLEFPRGRGMGSSKQQKKTFLGGSMYIFWNCIFTCNKF